MSGGMIGDRGRAFWFVAPVVGVVVLAMAQLASYPKAESSQSLSPNSTRGKTSEPPPLKTSEPAALPSAECAAPDHRATCDEGESETANQVIALDASGLTQGEKLRYLLSSQQRRDAAADMPIRARAGIDLAHATRCVTTILRAKGRADYGDPVELEERGGFSLKSVSPDEWVFAADRARFAFSRGEFPAYDLARDRIARVEDGADLVELDAQQALEFDKLHAAALDALEAAND